MSYTTNYYLEISGPSERADLNKLRDFIKVTGFIECYNKWAKNTFYDADKEVGGLSLLFPEWTFKLTSVGEDYLVSAKGGYVDVGQVIYKNGYSSKNNLRFEHTKEWTKNNDADAEWAQQAYDEALEYKTEYANKENTKKAALNKLSEEERRALGLE